MGHQTKTELTYWTRPEPPDQAEAMQMINGTHPGVKKYQTIVHDIREVDTSFNIDEHAFQVLSGKPILSSPLDLDLETALGVRTKYWPQLSKLLRNAFGARSVVMLESTTRTSADRPHERKQDREGAYIADKKAGQPFHIVHNDYSPVGSRNVLRAMKPTFYEENGNADSADDQRAFWALREEILSSERRAIQKSGATDHTDWDGSGYDGPRWAHFSIWRPIDTVYSDPLALLNPQSLMTLPCDYDTKAKTFVSIPLKHHGRLGLENYIGANIMPRPPADGAPPHEWFYLSEQTPDEVFAIKFFDSEAWREGSRIMPFCAHSAFRLPDQEGKPARRSIETRCLVVW